MRLDVDIIIRSFCVTTSCRSTWVEVNRCCNVAKFLTTRYRMVSLRLRLC